MTTIHGVLGAFSIYPRNQPPQRRVEGNRRGVPPSYINEVLGDAGFDPRFQRVLRHEVDLDAEFVGQFVLQSNEIEQCHRLLERDEDVEIAVGALFAPRVRAEDPQLADRILPFESRLWCS